jgi:uncharacterized membrane protein
MLYSPLLPVHIAGGIVGIISGTAAMSFRKGSPPHVLAGRVFVAAMLIMAAAAVYLATIKHQPSNIGGGILTFYLIGTAWLTARRKEKETSKYDLALLLIPVALGVLTWMNGIRVMRSGATSEDGVPVGMNFFMGTVMLLAAAGDIRMLIRGGVAGTKRVVRHLWRMCFGWFIATGSFFLGQAMKVFPTAVFKSGAMIIPAVAPLVLLIFWVFRVWLGKKYRRSLMLAGGD